jgi:hypothetical protein
VFIDVEAETGAYWPGLLERRLQRSRVLVAVIGCHSGSTQMRNP